MQYHVEPRVASPKPWSIIDLPHHKWDGPERTMVLVLAIVATTMLAAIAMLPTTEEKAQVLLSQGRTAEAISLFEQKRSLQLLNPFETYALAQLYEAQSDTGALSTLLEDEIEQRPESAWALDRLIVLYRSEQQHTLEASAIGKRFQSDPNRPDLLRLIQLYRLTGDRQGERAVLEAALSAGLLDPAQTARLDFLVTHPLATPVTWLAP